MAKLCSCLHTSVPPITKKCPDDKCVYAPNLLIKGTQQTSVTKCNEEGIINILSEIDTVLCVKKQYQVDIKILKIDGLTDSAVYSNGQIRFRLKNIDKPFGLIKYKVVCGRYADIGEIMILPYNPCMGVVCSSGSNCDICTGLCVANEESDLSIEITEPYYSQPEIGITIN